MALGNKTLDDLLGPISKQLGRNAVPETVAVPAWEFKAERYTDGLNHDQLVDMFAAEAEKVRVEVDRCKSADLAACIAKVVGQGTPDGGEACSVVYAAEPRFLDAGLAEALEAESLVSEATVWDEANGDACIEAARVATYGITYATAGIAETGTVAQPTSALCGRAISLLPLVHVAVVDAATIQATMSDVLAAYGEDRTKLPSQVCFISGPSATADIELVRVEGVHGPMYVHYIIVE